MTINVILSGEQVNKIIAALDGIASRIDRLADAWEGKTPSPAPVEVEPEPGNDPKLFADDDAIVDPGQNLGWTADGKPRRRAKPGKVSKAGREILKDYVSIAYVLNRTFKATPANFHGEKTEMFLTAVRATGARTTIHKRHRFVHREDADKVVDWINEHRTK